MPNTTLARRLLVALCAPLRSPSNPFRCRDANCCSGCTCPALPYLVPHCQPPQACEPCMVGAPQDPATGAFLCLQTPCVHWDTLGYVLRDLLGFRRA